MEYGHEKIRMTKDDMKRIKSFGGSSLKLLGFKDQGKLKDYMNVRSSYFLYPDEEAVKGSS